MATTRTTAPRGDLARAELGILLALAFARLLLHLLTNGQYEIGRAHV